MDPSFEGEEDKDRVEKESDGDVASFQEVFFKLKERLEGLGQSDLSAMVKTPRVKRTKKAMVCALLCERLLWAKKIPFLKAVCKEFGLAVSGKKEALVVRLAEHLQVDDGIVMAKAKTEREQEIDKMSKEELEKELSVYEINYQKSKADMKRKLLHAEKFRMKKVFVREPVPIQHHLSLQFQVGDVATILHLPHDLIEAHIMPHVQVDFHIAWALTQSCRHLHQHGKAMMIRIAEENFGHGADARTMFMFLKLRVPKKKERSLF